MTFWEAVILGIVEGLTEFVPVSSTGHLLLTTSVLGLDADGVDSYTIVIQLGAVMAAVVHYRAQLAETARTALETGGAGFRLLRNLLIAFIPAAVLGLTFEGFIEERLMTSDMWIAAALIVGGILMIVVERLMSPERRAREGLDQITMTDALFVGFAQCMALWPGMSRSMSTIVGGQLRGFSNRLAADFSFLLAIPTLGGATCYKLLKDYRVLMDLGQGGGLVLGTGLVVSFFTGWAAIAWFLRIVKRVGMTPFGIYRIIIGLIVLGVLWRMA